MSTMGHFLWKGDKNIKPNRNIWQQMEAAPWDELCRCRSAAGAFDPHPSQVHLPEIRVLQELPHYINSFCCLVLDEWGRSHLSFFFFFWFSFFAKSGRLGLFSIKYYLLQTGLTSLFKKCRGFPAQHSKDTWIHIKCFFYESRNRCCLAYENV